MCYRLTNGVACDLVEHDAMDVFALQVTARIQYLSQVPCDGLALAIGVGCQVKRFRFAQRARDGIDVALVFLEHLVFHGVALLGIDGAFLGHEVADVPV